MLDKEKVRIGNGVLVFDDLAPGESTKVQFQCSTVGVPVTLALAAHRDAEGIPSANKVVPLKIISVPAGAKLTVDEKDEGITPTLANLTVGTHKVDLNKDGFAPATTPVDIKADEMPGGSITIIKDAVPNDAQDFTFDIAEPPPDAALDPHRNEVRVDGRHEVRRNQVKKILSWAS
jgi:hypothetical protein